MTDDNFTWLSVFKDKISPHLPTAGLMMFRDALASNSDELDQGMTVYPSNSQHPVKSCCAIAYVGWKSNGFVTGMHVCNWFDEIVSKIEVGDDGHRHAVCSPFLDYWDDTPRDQVFRELLPVVDEILAGR